jgi:SAM-dependent methyltransferase
VSATGDPSGTLVFGPYAQYYDLLYRDKDYRGEAAFVHRLLQSRKPETRTVLDLGCGTGAHAEALAALGVSVHGVDRSDGMLAAAERRRAAAEPALAERMTFSAGDVRTVRLARSFDAVVALFHVASYQVGNDGLRALFETAREHLVPGGLFVFDAWYGPAVLTDPPVVRVKRMEDDRIQVTRVAEPVLHANRNVVDVNYQVLIRNRATGAVDELAERHEMRYLFLPEVDMLFDEFGFTRVACGQWMTEREAGTHSWNVYFSASLAR